MTKTTSKESSIVNVSISLNANVTLTPELHNKIKVKFPEMYDRIKNDDESLAMIALFNWADNSFKLDETNDQNINSVIFI